MSESSVFLDHHLAQTTMYPFALDIVRAEGIYLYDRQNRPYIDFVSGIGVNNIGHKNEAVNQAIKDQVDKHLHVMVYGEYMQEAQVRAAKELTDLLPDTLNCCYFVNSGTEANEAALKLAKRVTHRSKIISCRGAYHGSTHGSLSISGNEKKKAVFRPLLPDVHFVRFGEIDDLQAIDTSTACFIMETIQGDAGVRIPSIEYMRALRKRCTETGTLLIFDEIQCGMGRAGTFFAFEQFDCIPDILTLGKALGGGMPIGCLVSSRSHMQQFTFNPMLGHISTFAGHPVVCAAAAATLSFLRSTGTVTHVQRKGERLANALRKFPLVKEVRQRGLFFAIDLESEEQVQKIVFRCLEKGLVSFWFLSCPWSFRIAPPLTITDEEIEACLRILEEAFLYASN